MGEYRLWFNVARFVLEEGEIGGLKEDKERRLKADVKGSGGGADGRFQQPVSNPWGVGGRSFKDTLLGEKKESVPVRSVTINNNVKAFERVHGRAVIVRTKDLKALRELKCTMKDLGMPGGRVQYLGGVSALVSFEEKEEAIKALEIGKAAEHKFSHISMWEGQSVGFERFAWLKVHGIPLHILTNCVIDLVGGLFGKIVHKVERSEEDRDLSFEFVGVLEGEGRRIADEVTVNWNDQKFRVWVLEEMGDWVPEFDEPIGDVGFRDGSDVMGSEFRPEEVTGMEGGGYKSPKLNDDINDQSMEEVFKDESYDISNKSEAIFNLGTSNIKKRKKYKKKVRMGQPNIEKSDSLERPGKGKRARCSPDIFGLNPFIFGNENGKTLEAEKDLQVAVEVGESEGVSGTMQDLNSFPIVAGEGDTTAS